MKGQFFITTIIIKSTTVFMQLSKLLKRGCPKLSISILPCERGNSPQFLQGRIVQNGKLFLTFLFFDLKNIENGAFFRRYIGGYFHVM